MTSFAPFRPIPHLVRACLSIIGASLLAAHSQAWAPSLQIGWESNDNVSKSIREEKSDTALTAALDISTHRLINRDWQLSYGGSLQTSFWQDYDKLDLTELGIHATLRRKYGLGPYAPRLELHAEIMHQFSKVDEWSGNWARGGVTFLKRFTPAWQFSLGSELARLDAKRAVYSTTDLTTTATLDFDPTDVWRISLAMSYGDGDQLSWCRASWPPFASTPQWLDGVFGGDWFPYQSEGHTVAGRISVSRAIGFNANLTLEYSASEARAVKKHVYRDHIIRLHYTHAF